MNGRAGSSKTPGMVGKWGIGVNEYGEHLADVSAERLLFLANTLQRTMIHRYTHGGGRDERDGEKECAQLYSSG